MIISSSSLSSHRDVKLYLLAVFGLNIKVKVTVLLPIFYNVKLHILYINLYLRNLLPNSPLFTLGFIILSPLYLRCGVI